jgi:hypothetical protein
MRLAIVDTSRSKRIKIDSRLPFYSSEAVLRAVRGSILVVL